MPEKGWGRPSLQAEQWRRLLWALKQSDAASPGGTDTGKRKKSLDEMQLTELIDEAAKNGLINAASESLARLAKDARNLVHPGKVARSGVSCSKATALTALAGLYCMIEDLKQLALRKDKLGALRLNGPEVRSGSGRANDAAIVKDLFGSEAEIHRPARERPSWRDLARHVSVNNSGDAMPTNAKIVRRVFGVVEE